MVDTYVKNLGSEGLNPPTPTYLYPPHIEECGKGEGCGEGEGYGEGEG